ncbi:MAG: nitrile hydratase subunit beta [Alphaproteobacteria bacterium]|nr:nitrile hydratase subunit beta [Alphaproteobacteria bacterium]
MDGIHDLGGREGFGAIDVDEKEEPFHHPWEGRIRGIVHAIRNPGDWNIDWFRHCRELIEPVDYLSRPYFDQWLQTYAAMIVNSGVATVEEVASGKAKTPGPDLASPMAPDEVARASNQAENYKRDTGANPIFAIGEPVVAKSHAAVGHTRLPAYVRGRRGWIESYHGIQLFPDEHALGEESAQPLYTVGFNASELWTEAAESHDQVFLNLWESYLDPT